MSRSNSYVIDPRTVEDIRNEVGTLAKSYTPEWEFSTKNPDAGSVISLIFADQMKDNVRRFNCVLDKYETELVNMLGLSLQPANPAGGVIIMGINNTSMNGIPVGKGTKFTAESESGETVMFETCADLYVTSSTLTDIISVSGDKGRIICDKGSLKAAKLLPGTPVIDDEEEFIDMVEETQSDDEILDEEVELIPEENIPIFDYDRKGIECSGILLYHRHIFDITGDYIYIHFDSRDKHIAETFTDETKFKVSYYTKDGFKEFDYTGFKDNALILRRNAADTKVKVKDNEYNVVFIEARGPVTEEMNVRSIQLSAAGNDYKPSYVYTSGSETSGDKFFPFGETLSIYSECNIGNDKVFSQGNSLITIRFDMEFVERVVQLPRHEQELALKPIMKKPKVLMYDVMAHCFCESVSFEYFNGTGYKKLPCFKDYQSIFNGNSGGTMTIQFYCPVDWAPNEVGGYNERNIRMQLLRADNCYIQPCTHKAPKISNMSISYSYKGRYVNPEIVKRAHSTGISEITNQLSGNKSITIFSPLQYDKNRMLFGFSRKFEGAPICILFDIEEKTMSSGGNIQFEYSTLKGYKELKVIDHTNGLKNSGTLLFIPPTDFSAVEFEGLKKYWIRLTDIESSYTETERSHPVIKRIMMNAAEVVNTVTGSEESFYIDIAGAWMTYRLNAGHIFDIDVFVNEYGSLTQEEMDFLMETQPENVRVEYNAISNISRFDVRWNEVDNFDLTTAQDRHYVLDRSDNTITFGDGAVHRIPKNTGGVSFTVRCRYCNGAEANLPENAINSSVNNILFINGISNPIPTYGGSDIETIERVHRRGASILSSRNRLISDRDYTRAIEAYSTEIVKNKCICKDGIISTVIMMKDFYSGSYSFNKIKEPLKKYLLEHSEATVDSDSLLIVEPTYVTLTVELWLEMDDPEDTFEAQADLISGLNEYIDPMRGRSGAGWNIGMVPKEHQIKLLLNSYSINGNIRRYLISARYLDETGEHQTDLTSLNISGTMIAVNGVHKIFIQ